MTALDEELRSQTVIFDKAAKRLLEPTPDVGRQEPRSGLTALVVGKRIRHRRKQLGLTLDALGREIGLSGSAVSLIENGRREAKVSTLSDLAGALRCDLAELLTAAAPSRRAALELQLEQAQRSPSFESLGVRPVRPGPSLPLDALECLVALHARVEASEAARDATPEYARRANTELRARIRASDNYFLGIEELAGALHDRATPGDGPVTRHRINAIAEYLGFTLHLVGDVPSSTRSVTDLRNRRIFLRGSIDGATQRSLALAALGHLVLDHRPPQDYAEFLAQRVEVNYFAAAVLMPQGWAVPFLQQAKHDRDLEIDDLRDRYLVSYETAAHRFTNLATTHLDIGVHFMKINRAGIIHKVYANDGVALPTDPGGSVEGQRVCRFWTARQVFEQQDWNQPYQQYTDTPTGTFWCTAVAEQAEWEVYSVAVGTPYEQVKWFRGRGTPHRSRSTCPDPACCTLPPPELAGRWRDSVWPSAQVHSSLLASLPAGAFPGVDQTEVLEFLDRHAAL